MKIDHVGYLTYDIEKAIKDFVENWGYLQETEIINDNIPDAETGVIRNVNLCFLRNQGVRVELVSPMNENAVVAKTLAKQGAGPYHICYRTENLDEKIEQLRKDKWIIVQKPAKAVAFQNARVVFMFKKNTGLIEIVEEIGDRNETVELFGKE